MKALHPFCRLGGKHRSFLEVHLAKSRRIGRLVGRPLPHVITTSYLTHEPIEAYLAAEGDPRGRPYGYGGRYTFRPAAPSACGMIPMTRDLHFAWEEMPQQMLDEQQQKVRDSLRAALIGGAGPVKAATTPIMCRCNACTRSATGTKCRTC